MARVVVCGIGNEHRHDDGAGLAVARALAALRPGITDAGPLGEPLDLLGRWDDADLAVVLDATRSGAGPGTIRLEELARDDAPLTRRSRPAAPSTHGLGLDDVLCLARTLGNAPARVVLVGIEGDDFSPGTGLHRDVAAAVGRAAALVDALLDAALPCA